MVISIDIGEASMPPPKLTSSPVSSQASDDDLEGGAYEEDSFNPECGEKIESKFITTGTGNASFLRRQSQMGKLSLRRKSELSLPFRHQPSSFSSTDGDSNDFMKRLTSINGDPDDKEKSARRKSIEDGLPVTNSPTTTTSNKEEFLKRLRSSMASRRSSSFRNSPSSPPAATSRSNSPTIADGSALLNTSQNYPVEEDVEACSPSEPKALPKKFRLKRFFRIKHLLIIPILLTIGYVVIQYYKVTSLQSELNLSIASRDHLQKSQGTLITELHKYKDTHEKMKKVNNDLSSHLKKLREEHVEGQKELDKFRNAEKTTSWSEVRLGKFIKGIQDWSKKRVLSK